MTGNAVAQGVGKLPALGGSPACEKTPATGRAYTQATRTGDLAHARGFGNSVVLPDGTVAVFGGQAFPVPFSDAASVLTPPLRDPSTGRFGPLATMAVPHEHHSVTNLLPDGRVPPAAGGPAPSTARFLTPPGRKAAAGGVFGGAMPGRRAPTAGAGGCR